MIDTKTIRRLINEIHKLLNRFYQPTLDEKYFIELNAKDWLKIRFYGDYIKTPWDRISIFILEDAVYVLNSVWKRARFRYIRGKLCAKSK